MEDEVANVTSAEVDTERDTGIRVSNILVPEWNLDRVEVLACDSRRLLGSIQLEVILRFHQKMQLMEVEYVVLARVIFDGPFFDRTLRGDDVGSSVGIENMFRLSLHSHEKLCLVILVKEYRPRGGYGRQSETRETRPTGVHWRNRANIVGRWRRPDY